MSENKAKCVYLNLDKGGEQVLDITTTLAVPLQVEKYGCGLISIHGNVVPTGAKKSPLYLCIDVCEDSNVGEIKMPVLRQLVRNSRGMIIDVNNIIWLRVNRPIVRSLRVYIADSVGRLASLSTGWLSCALLFIPK